MGLLLEEKLCQLNLFLCIALLQRLQSEPHQRKINRGARLPAAPHPSAFCGWALSAAAFVWSRDPGGLSAVGRGSPVKLMA